MNNDERYMRRCLQLAANGIQGTRPNPMVGAVIVADGRIIGEGYHVRYGDGHAEVNAFASVKAADERLLKEATVYVSLEPCAHYGKTPPCAELIVIEVTVGVLETECQWMNRRFFTYHSKQRPYIILKWAQTANGFIDDHFQPVTISNEQTQMLSHQLRAEEDAILVGHTTLERDHPHLDVRHWHGPDPKRLVLTRQRPLPQLMDDLYQQGVQSLIVEGGRQTHEAFMAASLWDEIRVETAPTTVADGTRAPQLPATVRLCSRKEYGDNTIAIYLPR